MRTQIILLDSHDDHVSARDKMGWTQTQKIILVWPDSGIVLDRRLDLILIDRHSRALGAKLAIVTRNRKVVQNAKELGIPVYKSLVRAKRSQWQKGNHPLNQPNTIEPKLIKTKTNPDADQTEHLRFDDFSPLEFTNPLLRILVFALGVVAVIFVAGIFIPYAEIHIKAETNTQELTMELSAVPDIETVSLSGEVPSEPSSIIVEGRASIPTSGSTLFPSAYAKGNALLTNLSESSITINNGSIFRSSDDPLQRYETVESVIIEPGSEESAQAALQALSPGGYSNLIANSTLILEGSDSISINARNQLPISGGKDILVPAVDRVDQRKLYRILESQLRISALEEFLQESPSNYQVIKPTLALKKVIHEEYYPSIGQPANQIDLELRLEYEIQTIKYDTVENLIQHVMDTRIATEYTAVDTSFQMDNISELSMNDKGNATWNIKAEREVITHIEGNEVAISSIGMMPTNAISVLQEKYTLSDSPEIFLFPEWWPRLPLLPFRIEVFIDRANLPSSPKISQNSNRVR